jgi:phosphomevalonate kinase
VTKTIASAPGKIVLCGEYAVLDGAPAICLAVDRYARAEVSPADGGSLMVRTRGHLDGDWDIRVKEDGTIEWPGDVPDLLREVWNTLQFETAFDISLDTSEFFDPQSGSKLGLGSSAALTVALVLALLSAKDDSRDAAMLAGDAHRRLQHDLGSGVDIAASLEGGVIEYRMRASGRSRATGWPAGLKYRVLWSGKPASTGDKLRKFEETRRGGGSKSTERLCAMAERIAEVWHREGASAVLGAFRKYVDALAQFDVDHDLGIFDAGHREMAAAAHGPEIVYKPCGAGGGDAGIVLASDERAIDEFESRAAEQGFQVLDISLAEKGVLVESINHD